MARHMEFDSLSSDYDILFFSLVRVFSLIAQMLVLTYEAAGTDRLVPYFNHRFAPLKPIQIYGRYAKAEPVCKPSHAVWYAWQDITCSQQESWR